MRSDVRAMMEACIDALPEAFRTVFVLRAVEVMSVEEVSAALGLPQATVRTHFFRARGLLRKGLARDVDRGMAPGRNTTDAATIAWAHSRSTGHPPAAGARHCSGECHGSA